MEDRIVEEVRRIREEHAAQFNYDIDAIFAVLKRLESESKQPRVSFGLAALRSRVRRRRPFRPTANQIDTPV